MHSCLPSLIFRSPAPLSPPRDSVTWLRSSLTFRPYISSIAVGTTSASVLYNFIYPSSLTHLVIRSNRADGDDVIGLCQTLSCLTHLIVLNMYSLQMDSHGIGFFSACLPHFSCASVLSSLFLHLIPLGNKGLRLLASAISGTKGLKS